MKSIIKLLAVLSIVLTTSTAFAGVIAKLPITITKSGTYTLNKNLVYTANLVDAITVGADDVTIDFKGFGITGIGIASGYSGVNIAAHSRVTITNGFITGFKYGTSGADKSFFITVTNMKISGNGTGISLPYSPAVIRDCVVYANSEGITAIGDGSIISGNVIQSNGGIGLEVGFAAAISGNTICSNNTGIMLNNSGQVIANNTIFHNNYGVVGASSDVLINNNAIYGNITDNVIVSGSSVFGTNLD